MMRPRLSSRELRRRALVRVATASPYQHVDTVSHTLLRSLAMRSWTIAALAALAFLALPAASQARPQEKAKDGRPNILGGMTDDQAAADLAQMPNVRRLLAEQGTTFTNAV